MDKEMELIYGHRKRLKDKILTINLETNIISDTELLEVILFYSVPRKDVKVLSKKLLRTFKTFAGVINAPSERLLEFDNVTSNTLALFKIIKLSCVAMLKEEVNNSHTLDTFNKIIDYCYLDLSYETTEKIKIIYLNKQNTIIEDEIIHEGDVSTSTFYPRNILRKALGNGATSLILVHNHPSGNPSPSAEDIESTLRLQTVLNNINISLKDHIIIGKNGIKSMRQLGILN